jgi:hypothetical protein
MNGVSAHPVGTAQPWKQCYRAALLENDPGKRPLLIDEAEKAIVTRARELFQATGDNAEEQEALDDAIYALHAFRTAIGLSPKLPVSKHAA